MNIPLVQLANIARDKTFVDLEQFVKVFSANSEGRKCTFAHASHPIPWTHKSFLCEIFYFHSLRKISPSKVSRYTALQTCLQ